MTGLAQDLRYALRKLRKSPGFTAVAVITLALGIGANTAIFSILEGVVLAPLPYFQPDRLVIVWENNPRFPRVWNSYPNFLDWQRSAHSFQQMAAFREQGIDLTFPGAASHLKASQISSGFFSTLGSRLALGREFIGHTITAGFASFGPCEIVGVVNHVKYAELQDNDPANQYQAYYSLDQDPDQWVPLNYADASFVVRTCLDAATLIPNVKRAVQQFATDQPVYDVQTMQQIVSDSMSAQRFPMILLSAFAGLALLLASVGIYGTISYSAAQRVQEIGIRMALGADKGNVLRMFVRQELKLALSGIAVGIVAALILTRTLSSFSHLLYEVGAADPVTFSSVSILLIVLDCGQLHSGAARGESRSHGGAAIRMTPHTIQVGERQTIKGSTQGQPKSFLRGANLWSMLRLSDDAHDQYREAAAHILANLEYELRIPRHTVWLGTADGEYERHLRIPGRAGRSDSNSVAGRAADRIDRATDHRPCQRSHLGTAGPQASVLSCGRDS